MSDSDAHRASLKGVCDYYSDKIRSHGAAPRGVDWGSAERQLERFRQLVRGIGGVPFSLLDVGCGYGALWDHLDAQGETFRYHGMDISEAMISLAKSLHEGKAGCAFSVGSQPVGAFDYVVASGIFNVTAGADQTSWEKHVHRTLRAMFSACEKMCAFNFLTCYADADHMDSSLYYADPRAILDFCITRLSPNVNLAHHYGAWDFTVQVFKDT